VKIIVIGATGTIGSAVADALAGRGHDVVRAARSHGDQRVDIESAESIARMYEAVGSFDAVVCAAGRASFKPLEELSEEDFHLGLHSKLMGQVNVVRLGLARVADGGSFTLTSGVLAGEPVPGSAAFSLTNAAVEAFAHAAALEMPRRVRVNVVSPPWVSETLEAMGRSGSGGLPAASVAQAYVESVEGGRNGATIDARAFR